MESGSEKALWATMGGDNLVKGQFPSPWQDAAMRYTPRNIRDALTLCEFLYLNYGVYRKASERIVDYFLTKPIFKGQDDDEREKFQKIMNNDFGVIQRLQEVGYDYMCYGNSFCSMHFPFRRVLRCVSCSTERHIDDIDFQFSSVDFTFSARCSRCKTVKRHMVHNYRTANPKKIRLVRWDPKRIVIENNPYTGDTRYWLDISAIVQNKVRMGDRFTLSTLPWPFIQAIKNNQRFLFKDEGIYHMREATLAGLNLGGWGIPSVLSAFKNFFRIQMLMRYDETLMMDYIVPLRIMSPAELKIPMGNDFVSVNVENFVREASTAVARHRIDGADWLFMPYGVNYQAVGGEGQQLSMATKDVLAQEEERLLQVRGLPAEIYKATLTTQVAPVGLRLFERSHTALIRNFNSLLGWTSSSIARYLDHGEADVELEPVTIADNIEDKQFRLQAAAGGLISKQTGFGPLGIDNKEETKRKIQEQMDEQKQVAKAQQDQQMESMSLDAPQGEQASQSQSGGMAVGDVEAQGDEMARQLADPQMPEANRRQQLSALNKTNPTLHAVVIKKLDQIRNSNGTQAGINAAFGKSASFNKKFKHVQVLWMADAFFPTGAKWANTIGYVHSNQKTALNILWRDRPFCFHLTDENMAMEPMELMTKIAQLLP